MNSYFIAILIPALVQFALFLRWLHRRVRDDELQRAFILDLARNHLPYIHTALHRISKKLFIELPDPPPQHYVAVNGDRTVSRAADPSPI